MKNRLITKNSQLVFYNAMVVCLAENNFKDEGVSGNLHSFSFENSTNKVGVSVELKNNSNLLSIFSKFEKPIKAVTNPHTGKYNFNVPCDNTEDDLEVCIDVCKDFIKSLATLCNIVQE